MRFNHKLIEKNKFLLSRFYNSDIKELRKLAKWQFGSLGEKIAINYLVKKKIIVTSPPKFHEISEDDITDDKIFERYNNSIGKIVGIYSSSKSKMIKVDSFEEYKKEYKIIYVEDQKYINNNHKERIKLFFKSDRLIKSYIENEINYKFLCNSLDFLAINKMNNEVLFVEVKSSFISCSMHHRKGKLELSDHQRGLISNLVNNGFNVFIIKINFCECENIFLWYQKVEV